MDITNTAAVMPKGIGILSGAGALALTHLYTSWRQRELQRDESKKTRELQQLMQQREFANAEKLQRQIANWRFENDLQLQANSFNNKTAEWERTKFYDNTWPLNGTPSYYVGLFRKYQKQYPRLFQVIVTSLPKDRETEVTLVESFFATYYPMTGASPVFYYNQDWKDSMRDRKGTAQMFALHEALEGLPTLVLIPSFVASTGKFQLKVSFWGLGDFNPPQHHDFTTVDVEELAQDLMRQQIEKKLGTIKKNPELYENDPNVKVWRNQQAFRMKSRENGNTDEETEELLKQGMAGRYQLDPSWKAEKTAGALSAMMSVLGAAMADFHHLLDSEPVEPLLPGIIRDKWPDEADAFLGMYGKMILGLLDANKFAADPQLLTLPLAQAVAAKAFKKAGDIETARELQKRAWTQLTKWYKGTNIEMAGGHFRTTQILNETSAGVPTSASDWFSQKQLQVAAMIPFTAAALYLVIDLSGGPNAKNYSVHYTMQPPNLDDDTCRTKEMWFRFIPAGTFMMGSPDNELGRSDCYGGEALHSVTLTKPFYIGVFPVTLAQYALVMGEEGCMEVVNAILNDGRQDRSYNEYRVENQFVRHQKSCPMVNISYDTIRGHKQGTKFPESNDVDTSSFLGIFRMRTSSMVDLPTEAQWEYACRAGTSTALNSGKNLLNDGENSNLRELGWGYKCFGNMDCFRNDYMKVGVHKPNNWGLYNMHGGTYEWCLDWEDSYNLSQIIDPKGQASGNDRNARVTRGGTCHHEARNSRSASRAAKCPYIIDDGIGFRICVLPSP